MAAAVTAARVAFIGLGRMGRPMAARLLGAGFGLACFDVAPAACTPLVQAGAEAAGSPAGAAGRADVVVTMLPDGRAVRDAMFGAGGAAQAMRRGSLLIDMSSSDPLASRALGEELGGLGIGMIDAPVSGGVARAVDGSLTIMAGGEAALLQAAQPVLAAMGSRVFHTGRLGSGHAVKALNNFVSAAGLAAACEALLAAEAFGIAPDALVDVLNASTGRNNSTEVKLKPQILSGRFASGFAMALMAKDLRTAADLAAGLDCARDLMSAQAGLWARALDDLGEAADHTEIYRYLQRTPRARQPGPA